MNTYIKGNYRKSIFQNDKGYVIGIFKVKDTNIESMEDFVGKTVTFTGYFGDLNEDDTYLFYGEEIVHPRFGYQFQVSSYERVKPDDIDGIIEFLASDLFPGIGEKMAQKIVEVLGEHTLDKILDDSSCLSIVPKLSEKKASTIVDVLVKYEESHKTIVYLCELGFSMKDALGIYNAYKSNTINKIEHNIYDLIDDIVDLSFVKIDEIARKLNYRVDDERRIKASIIYIMKTIVFKNGDSYLLFDDIYSITVRYLKISVDEGVFGLYLEQLATGSKIVIDNDKYYLKDIWDSENNIIEKLYRLSSIKNRKNTKLNGYIDNLEEINGIKYNDKQKEAIKKAINNNLLIITGGPGTGKTTIIKAIVEIYQNMNNYKSEDLIKHLALLAPTGRASKRMTETSNLQASTIHRFLKWNKDNNEFAVNEYNKAESDLIIVDEVSMIDIPLLDSLLKGTKDDIKLILVGDYNQLPSVGPGQLLKDLIDSNMIDTVHLDLLYRQDENSYINTLAEEIRSNNLGENFLDTRSDYTFLECNGLSIKQNLSRLCEKINSKGYDPKRIQIMAPMYHGENGIDNLNKELQSIFNPPSDTKREIKYGDVIFRENDKILQLVNMPDENVYNGDIGYIKYIIKGETSKSGKDEIYVDYDGNVVKYQNKDYPKITHGYIVSIHKSQGSEFDMVIIPICRSYSKMLYRKLIYTGITRAKKKLILIGEADAFIYSVTNNNEYIRKSDLVNKIKKRIIS